MEHYFGNMSKLKQIITNFSGHFRPFWKNCVEILLNWAGGRGEGNLGDELHVCLTHVMKGESKTQAQTLSGRSNTQTQTKVGFS